MKKKFMFTDDSSFTHVKDEMRHSLTEHIVEDEMTKELYHHVVSHGSWVKFSYESIFMSHLLKGLGVTGFGRAYVADECKIKLPWYPQQMPKTQAVVELPKDIKLEDIQFGYMETEVGDKYKQTFAGKDFELHARLGATTKIKGSELLRDLFSCSVISFGKTTVGEEVYPLSFVLYGICLEKKKDMVRKLSTTDIASLPEVYAILTKFVEVDIEKAIKEFEDEVGADISELSKDLVKRQKIASFYLAEAKVENEM